MPPTTAQPAESPPPADERLTWLPESIRTADDDLTWLADSIEDSAENTLTEMKLGPGKFPGWRKFPRAVLWLIQTGIGLVFLFLLLSGLAAIPGLNVVAFGMLLDAEARVGRSGRMRDGFPLLDYSTRIGMIVLMVGLSLLPILLANSLANSQDVVRQLSGLSPGGRRIFCHVLQVFVFTHLLLAIANGGSFSCFFRPIRNVRRLASWLKSGEFSEAVNVWSERFWDVFKPLRHIKLAFFGIAGALCWLILPMALLSAATLTPRQENPAAVAAFASIVGVLLAIPVVAWLPLLQCHQAATGRFTAIFNIRVVREIIARAPLRWTLSTFLLFGLAIPLYASKIVIPPADAYWLLTPLFIATIYPTRLLIGWTYGSGIKAQRRQFVLLRWPFKILMFALLAIYAGFLFVIPLISESGFRGLLDNHAFLLPIPGFFR